MFQQDNAGPHSASATSSDTLPWPDRSTNLNPIEQLCDALDRCVLLRNPPTSDISATLTEQQHDLQNNSQRVIAQMAHALTKEISGSIPKEHPIPPYIFETTILDYDLKDLEKQTLLQAAGQLTTRK